MDQQKIKRINELYRKSKAEGLTEEERTVFKRGRNARSTAIARHASIADYRMATGLEALLGYLYLSRRMDRAVELVGTGLEKTGEWNQE